ncbi:MAG: Plasmid pRiA4b ORF-3-like protein [Planctomycetaceae bacterium]|nr:Plasmid pRiA4b ORF-3-like protein [Planctomycetaceae bacterium]
MQKPSSSQLKTLQATKFDESGPGTILADFETLLSFIGPDGLRSSGKNVRIPLAALNDLDERMTHPLRPKLERPQQVSFPHLNGLYLLLKSTGLGIASGQGASGRLVLNPPIISQWIALNPVEKYLTLFQALMTSNWGMISSDESSHSGPFRGVQTYLEHYCRRPKGGTSTPASEQFFGWTDQTTAALLELFGLLDIARDLPKKGENWRIKSAKVTEFGHAFMARLKDMSFEYNFMDIVLDGVSDEGQWLADIFRDVFPDCHNTLQPVEAEFVDGIWQFKVSWGTVWRRILIPADMSTDELVEGILKAFKFDSDHLYQFEMRDRSGQEFRIGPEGLDGVDEFSDEFAVGYLPLDPGGSMRFHFDFGADWRFDVKLEKILAPDESMTGLKITEKKGNAPKQYDYDNDGW